MFFLKYLDEKLMCFFYLATCMSTSLKLTFKIVCANYSFGSLTSTDCLAFLIAFLDAIPVRCIVPLL